MNFELESLNDYVIILKLYQLTAIAHQIMNFELEFLNDCVIILKLYQLTAHI